MSSFKMMARHKATREVHAVWALDDYFGKHEYGYLPDIEGAKALTSEEFDKEYKRIKNKKRTTEVKDN